MSFPFHVGIMEKKMETTKVHWAYIEFSWGYITNLGAQGSLSCCLLSCVKVR